MSTITNLLKNHNRLLFEIALKPLQGKRFQPTGFPNLGAATYGKDLLVESPQSMANRLEAVIWNDSENDLIPLLKGLSHITVEKEDKFLTDSILESHRMGSAYILEETKEKFKDKIMAELDSQKNLPISKKRLAEVLFKYDVNALLHGVFLASIDGRLRLPRTLSAFIEANNVEQVHSGGVKNDHVHASGDTAKGFGNVPFSRTEYTSNEITLYVDIDLAQIRGYGLGQEAEDLLILLALYKLKSFISDDLKLRTACNFQVDTNTLKAKKFEEFSLKNIPSLEKELSESLVKCKSKMVHSTVSYVEKKKAKENKNDSDTNQENDE